MMNHRSLTGALLAASLLALPAVAQTDARTLNNQVAQTNANAQAVNSANAAINVANQAQYDADRSAYMDALVRHDAQVDRRDARWARQQTAYADAMAVWRVQVEQCKKGRQKACDLPTPNPADYY